MWRAYDHGPHCHAGTGPTDAVLRRPGAAPSPAAYEVACLAGMLCSFAEAAAVTRPKRAGLRLGGSTVERAAESAGAEVGRRLAAGETFGPARHRAWHKDAEGTTCADVAVDATGVGPRGERGATAPGRRATVALAYNPVPEARDRRARPAGPPPRFAARYLAGLGGLAAPGAPRRRRAAQVGMDRAERWIALSDGGSGLEDWVRVNFGRVEAVLLDSSHAAGYLGDLAQAPYPGDEEARAGWSKGWCHRLTHEGGAAVLEGLRGLETRGRAAREVRAEVVRDFTDQAHRMDYPLYVAKGWAIGSGPVEAACTTVIGQRRKGSGMRWGEDGADALSHLRAPFKSGDRQWDAFWRPTPN